MHKMTSPDGMENTGTSSTSFSSSLADLNSSSNSNSNLSNAIASSAGLPRRRNSVDLSSNSSVSASLSSSMPLTSVNTSSGPVSASTSTGMSGISTGSSIEPSHVGHFASMSPRKPSIPVTRVNRKVQRRTQFQIALPDQVLAAIQAEHEQQAAVQRGWSSPHGEPYRPLGKPELNLKITPVLPFGSSVFQSNHRMMIFDGTEKKSEEPRAAQDVMNARSNSNASGFSGRFQSSSIMGSSYSVLSSTSSSFMAKNKENHLHFRHHEGRTTKLQKAPLMKPGATGVAAFPGLFSHHPSPRERKLAHKLQQSIAQFSPTRGVRLRLHRHQTTDSSMEVMQQVIQEGLTRVRLARSGNSNFLDHLQSTDQRDQCILQEQYSEMLIKNQTLQQEQQDELLQNTTRRIADNDINNSPSSPRRAGTTNANGSPAQSPLSVSYSQEMKRLQQSELDSSSKPCGSPEHGTEQYYLPYTTRVAQPLPLMCLPTINEYRAQLQDERQQNSPTNRFFASQKAVANAGQFTNLIDSNDLNGAPGGASGSPAVSPLSLTSSSSIKTGIAGAPPGPGRSSAPNESQTKLHKIERLQHAIDAMEQVKTNRASSLTKTLESLKTDRRECMQVKFRHFKIHQELQQDLHQMRLLSEQERKQQIARMVQQSAWYTQLLHHIVEERDPSVAGFSGGGGGGGGVIPLHPAERFILHALRTKVNEGKAFDRTFLFALIESLQLDHLVDDDVQNMLKYLRVVLAIPLDDWQQFFKSRHLPDPMEVIQLKAAHERKRQNRLSLIHKVVTMNSVLRRFPNLGLKKKSPGRSHRNLLKIPSVRDLQRVPENKSP